MYMRAHKPDDGRYVLYYIRALISLPSPWQYNSRIVRRLCFVFCNHDDTSQLSTWRTFRPIRLPNRLTHARPSDKSFSSRKLFENQTIAANFGTFQKRKRRFAGNRRQKPVHLLVSPVRFCLPRWAGKHPTYRFAQWDFHLDTTSIVHGSFEL